MHCSNPFKKRLTLTKLTLPTVFLLFSWLAQAQEESSPFSTIPFLKGTNHWADSVLQTMTPDERIAQLIMIPVYSNKDQIHMDSISYLVKEYKVGGLIFFQGGPVRQANMVNRYQMESKVPLMISIDAEWGLGMRLDSTIKYPYQMALGGIEEEKLIYRMGEEIARQSKRIGIHVNFAPVVDINNNANNPVIGFRSFGEEKENVARKALAYMNGMQDQNVLASAKHFPGHGDTNVDSHYGLPLIDFSRNRLDRMELYPFRELMKKGLGSVMVAHMNIPVLDDTPDLASTLSKPIVEGLLKEEMGYEGLVFTDALNMQGVAKFYPPGVVDVKALLAGNDMLLNTMDVKATIKEVKLALERGEIAQEEIDKRVYKVLAAKQWLGLDKYRPVETGNLVADLNNPAAKNLNRELVAASLTLLRNKEDILPVRDLKHQKIATVAIGATAPTAFQKSLERYGTMDHYFLAKEITLEEILSLKQQLKAYDLVIAGLHNLNLRAGNNFGIQAETSLFLKELIHSNKTVVSVFGNVYSLAFLEDLHLADGAIAAYQETELTQDIASQIIFGAVGAKGTLPVTINNHFKSGDGLKSIGGIRLAYAMPETVGLRTEDLKEIDLLVENAIQAEAMPGAQVLIAKEGKVIYQKAFGHHSYDRQIQVENDHLYDLASITKISTALASFMKLKGEGKFDENKTLGEYLPMAAGTDKNDMVYKDILTHQAGLKAFIVFWQNTMRKNGSFRWWTLKPDSSKRYPYRVAENLFIHRNYANKMYKGIMDSPLNENKDYVYSDLSFVLAPLVVNGITGMPFEQYVKEEIYAPIGAGKLTFNPYLHYPKNKIVATEYDSLFRRQLVLGTVHDEAAAMLGGVSGHAGLFGNANDLAKLMQMYLNDGKYGGEEIIKNNVVSQYSKCVYCEEGNYRAMGFDRPSTPGNPNGNAPASAPVTSFGHSGFTGTYTWIDPENKLIYVFLSNRVNPTRENRKLYQMNVRTDIMEVVYSAMGKTIDLKITGP